MTPDSWEDFFSGELTKNLFAKPAGQRDLEAEPPILTFETLKGKLVGRFSTALRLPERVYPVQLTAGAEDDPALDDEQNRLWRDSLGLVTETMEEMWPRAEAAVAAVKVAEERAEARKPSSITEWRARVVQAMEYAHREEGAWQDFDAALRFLQTDKRLLRQLAILEDLVLETEGCSNELASRIAEANKFRRDSDDYKRKIKRTFGLQDRLQRTMFDVRTICTTVTETKETDEAMQEIGKAFSGLNPFR